MSERFLVYIVIILDLARYIIRACFSRERMSYLPAKEQLDGQAKVVDSQAHY